MATTVSGIAQNSKAGAVIVTDSKEPIYIDGLVQWDVSLLNKYVEVTGKLTIESVSEKELTNEVGERKQGIPGKKKLLLNATWKLKN